MYSIHDLNVSTIFPIALDSMLKHGVLTNSRAGAVLRYPSPVCTTYLRPWERVLLYSERDANPFFHLFEALWILGGRQDVRYLSQFNSRMTEFSDNGTRFHGAYGYRLRHAEGGDQIERAISILTKNPESRQVVLQIWDEKLDLGASSKDIPCNDLVFVDVVGQRLDITVCCRSNDIIWGCYGANVVQFSMLQEYLACALGLPMGKYRQVSNNFHVYVDNPFWRKVSNGEVAINYGMDPYDNSDQRHFPLFSSSGDRDRFDFDLKRFLEMTQMIDRLFDNVAWLTPWFERVAAPMYRCWREHKTSGNGLSYVGEVGAWDWREAARQWLNKREEV